MTPPDPPPTFRRDALARAAATVAGLAVAAVIAFALAGHVAGIDARSLHPVTPPAAATPTASPLPLQDVGRNVLTRVLTVESDRSQAEALGTAWLLDARGDFVTNAHVVSGSLAVRLTDRSANTLVAQVIGRDEATDIAVLRVSGGFGAQPIPVDSEALPRPPLPVVDVASSRATGHGDLTLSTLSETGRDVPLQPGEAGTDASSPSVYHDMLVLSGAQVFQGNSGGPVLDGQGRVVGILTLASPDQPEAFAIPITRVIGRLRQYAAGG